MFSPAGEAARHLALLGWWLTGIASLVVILVAAAVLYSLKRRAPSLEAAAPTGSAQHDEARSPVLIGAACSAVVLLAAFAATVITLHATERPSRAPAVTITVIGHQWWWEVQYPDTDVSRSVITANEIHIPVGQLVRLNISSGDVVHSFWIPELQGKIDEIPGQTNVFWLEADRPGTYYGQCAKYCGMQHANMRLTVIAQPPATFEAWRQGQLEPADQPSDTLARAGAVAFLAAPCASCHSIRGTLALGRTAPDLTHLASRQTIAA